MAYISSKSDGTLLFSLGPDEEKVIGRAMLPSRDPKCSRSQIRCVFSNGTLQITALGKNPVFVDPVSRPRRVLTTNESTDLADGDSFCLFADEFPLVFRTTAPIAEAKKRSSSSSSSVAKTEAPPKPSKRLLSNDSDEEQQAAVASSTSSNAKKRSASTTIKLLKEEDSDFDVDAIPDTSNDEQLARALAEKNPSTTKLSGAAKKKPTTTTKKITKKKKKKTGKSIAIDSDDDAPSDNAKEDDDEDFKPQKKKKLLAENDDDGGDGDSRLLPFVVTRGEKRRLRRGKKPSCMYGADCYRKSAEHRRQYSHPGDSDDDREEDKEADQNGIQIY